MFTTNESLSISIIAACAAIGGVLSYALMRANIPQEEWNRITQKRHNFVQEHNLPYEGMPNTHGFASGSFKGSAVGIALSYFMGFPVNRETIAIGYGIGSIAGITFARHIEQQKQQEHARNL